MDLPTPSSLEELTARIRSGVQDRGFYVAAVDELEALWSSATLSPTEKLMRLHTFSAEQGWHAAAREECRSALFQSEKQGPVSAASWRLDGDVERALGGRYKGARQ